MLHRILKIINVTPYIIVCEWTNNEIRAIYMENKIKEWANEPDSIYRKLLDKNIFMSVKLDSETKTLFWDGLIDVRDTTGILTKAGLDIDPEILYEISLPLKQDKKAA